MTNDGKHHKIPAPAGTDYDSMLSGVAGLLEIVRFDLVVASDGAIWP